MTVEIESILKNEDLHALLEAAEASGQLRQSELQEILEPLELDPLEIDALYMEFDRRSIEVVEDPEKDKEPAPAPPPAAPPPPAARAAARRGPPPPPPPPPPGAGRPDPRCSRPRRRSSSRRR